MSTAPKTPPQPLWTWENKYGTTFGYFEHKDSWGVKTHKIYRRTKDLQGSSYWEPIQLSNEELLEVIAKVPSMIEKLKLELEMTEIGAEVIEKDARRRKDNALGALALIKAHLSRPGRRSKQWYKDLSRFVENVGNVLTAEAEDGDTE